MHKHIIVGVLLAFCSIIPSGVSAAEDCSDERDSIRISAVFGSVSEFILHFAEDKGFSAHHDICIEKGVGSASIQDLSTTLLAGDVDMIHSVNAAVLFNRNMKSEGSDIRAVMVGSLVPEIGFELGVLSCMPQADGRPCKPFTRTRDILGQEIAVGRLCVGKKFELVSPTLASVSPEKFSSAIESAIADAFYRSKDIHDAIGSNLEVLCKEKASEPEHLWLSTIYLRPVGFSGKRGVMLATGQVAGDILMEPSKLHRIDVFSLVNPFANDVDRFTGEPLEIKKVLFTGLFGRSDKLSTDLEYRSKIERVKKALDETIAYIKDPASHDEVLAAVERFAAMHPGDSMRELIESENPNRYFSNLTVSFRKSLLEASTCVDEERLESYALLNGLTQTDLNDLKDNRYLCE